MITSVQGAERGSLHLTSDESWKLTTRGKAVTDALVRGRPYVKYLYLNVANYQPNQEQGRRTERPMCAL